MKKLFALTLVLMLLVLTACGGDQETSGKAKSGKNTPGGTSQQQSVLPDGWDENKYGAYIYEVWDQDFLPDCFPAPPEGIKVDQTTFKDYDHDTMNGDYGVGPLYYESKEEYREYGVGFYATEEQLAAFVAAVEAGGMVGGQTEDGDWSFWNYFGGGWFMEIFARSSVAENDYAYYVSVSATDSLFSLPQQISGIPLPQIGMVNCDLSRNYTIQDFSDGYEDVDFDLSRDTLPQEYYAAWFHYYCATNQDAMDYAQQLKDLGWEVVWESDSEYGYRCCLEKDGIYAVSNYYTYDCLVEVGFSDMAENLSY